MSQCTRDLLEEIGGYHIEKRGEIQIKVKRIIALIHEDNCLCQVRQKNMFINNYYIELQFKHIC